MRMGRRALALLLVSAMPARAGAPVRVGTLRFGSLSWELEVMRRQGLVRGFALEATEYASAPAGQVALQAGTVDLVLQDWLWVSRQRQSGADWTMATVPAPLGAVMAPAGSGVLGVADLKGKRLGVAGGPLDKSWLLLRLYGERRAGFDLDGAVETVFGAAPLLLEQMRAGRLDAMLTFWPFAARAEAAGLRTVLDMAEVLAGLGLPRDMPMLGFAFSSVWAERNRAGLEAFLAASVAAREVLRRDDAMWEAIAPLTGARDGAEVGRLRDWYRQGFPGGLDPAAAARLYGMLVSVGGAALVGDATTLAPGTFWAG